MSDPKVQAMAKVFLEEGISKMIDTTLKAMEVDLKKNPQAYYRGSRQVFKALMAAAAQRMLEDGANTQLLQDTYNPLDAWELYLTRHPDIAAKLNPKAPPPPKLGLILGGKAYEETTLEELDAEKKEALMNECDCSCHDLAIPGGCGNCECINETKGDEVL